MSSKFWSSLCVPDINAMLNSDLSRSPTTYSLVPIVIYEVLAKTPLPPASKEASSSLLLFIVAFQFT